MIIRTTFSDNDFTIELEKYWDRFFFDNCYSAIEELKNSNDVKSVKLWVSKHDRIDTLIDKSIYRESEMTSDEIKEFEDIIKESIEAYIDKKYANDDVYSGSEYLSKVDYLKRMLDVKIRTQIRDKCENGEVVYYFLGHKKYITM